MLHLENIIRKYSSLICLFGVFYISLHDILLNIRCAATCFDMNNTLKKTTQTRKIQ